MLFKAGICSAQEKVTGYYTQAGKANLATSKPCNWGVKIPEAGDLDFSVSELMINKKYVNNGWQNYMLSLEADSGKTAALKARAEEKRQWRK